VADSKHSVGILGGMGVYATVNFITELYNLSNKERFRDLKLVIDNSVGIDEILESILFNGADQRAEQIGN
jgi:aspartate/glutamate racemase